MICNASMLVAFIFALPILISPGSIRAQDINTLKSGVVRIQNNRSGAVGTGFIVKVDANQVYIVTAAHVVKGDQYPRIYLFNQQSDALQAELLDREDDDTRGLALLRLKLHSTAASGITTLKLNSTLQLSGGEDIKVIGFPDGTTIWTVGSGSIARVEGRNLVFSGPIKGGNSGGPLIINGLVVGLVTDVSQSLAYATRGEAIELYINGIVPNLIGPAKPKDNQPVDSAAEARAREAERFNKAGRYEDAIGAATEAISLDKKLAFAYAQRAYAYINTRKYPDKKKYQQAVDDATEAIRLDRELAIAYAYRGVAYNRMDSHDQAIGDLTKAISLDSGLAVAYANRGASHLIKGNFDQAIEDCTAAIRINSRYWAAYMNRGRARYGKGEFARAIEDYSEAIRLEPENPSLYEHRADAYEKLGRKDLADKDRQKAEELRRKK